MATISHNHVKYQARLDFIQAVLQERFGLKEKAEVTPIQCDPECPFKYNNFVNRVYFNEPIIATNDGPGQPGCVPIPDDTKELIFRLANPDAEGMIRTTCIENEVATTALASAALAGFVPQIAPFVYAWGSASIESSGYFCRAWFADTIRTSGLKARSSANIILFDPKSNRITALIDYDFACMSHPSYEFLRSFDGAGGQFRGWSTDEANDGMALRHAKLHGFPSPLPPTTKDGVKWDIVKAWEDELEKLNVKIPRNMRGIDKVADVDTVQEI
ncbi:hypothetical protein V499_06594 [Pseudogymnoascus sp. VKM F-103]|uniref:Aminoglycoside phosphotransferase domain-containing protein n=1 Tax=Pseudogymnoascus verrucosus TaxID=342668 RepID=A0A1B8GMT8_9PEZI|nr:uncharacterized protein VE01_04847 [Pseudogymnoascus verrucosus]KFY73301.1 hypothetical protein V499_06594 [Pseudogymnoascus sp. VKM F-103]OBT97151.1 hypothetical protein VE01_04847 [Pseudogymnoascus verrucosus]